MQGPASALLIANTENACAATKLRTRRVHRSPLEGFGGADDTPHVDKAP